MSTIKLDIEGMSCQGCADSLSRRLTEEPGVASAAVSFESKIADVEYDADLLDQGQLTQVVEKAGFTGTVSA